MGGLQCEQWMEPRPQRGDKRPGLAGSFICCESLLWDVAVQEANGA